MCARPPLADITGTSADTEAESHRMDTVCMQGPDELAFPPLTRAQTMDSDNLALKQLSLAAGTLRSVKSGPAHISRATRQVFPSSSSDEAVSSQQGEAPSLRDQSCCSSDSPQASACRSGGCQPSLVSQRECSKGEACCKGTAASCAPERDHAVVTAGPEEQSRASAACVPPLTALEDGDQPKPRGVARVTVRRAMRKRPAVAVEADRDPSKPTFGDLEDLWRKDSEARSYCTTVCSAPAMCRGGQEGLVDPMPGISIDSSRRKRFKPSGNLQHPEGAQVLALLA